MTDIDTVAGQSHASDIGATFFTQDVSNEASWDELMGQVEQQFGRLDGLSQ